MIIFSTPTTVSVLTPSLNELPTICAEYNRDVFSTEIQSLKIEKGLALQDILTEVHAFLHRGKDLIQDGLFIYPPR